MRFNKFIPFALLYFFFNSVGLPFGLTWMALLAPLLYVWILQVRKEEVLMPFFLVMLPFIVMHIAVVGVELPVYMTSLLNLGMVYIFCQAFYTFLKSSRDPARIFQLLLVVNFIFCLVGILFFFTPWADIFWIRQEFTRGVTDFRRFRLFSYEASYYATLFIPLFFFFFLQYVFNQNKISSRWLLPMIALPLLLSFSIGVIAAALLSLLLTTLFYFRPLLSRRRFLNLVINAGFLLFSFLAVLVFYFRHNPFFTRLVNIFSGSDTSAQGRISDSFLFARQLLADKNECWGIGLGQVKLLGHDLLQGYYLYNMDFVATIPNGMAETLAIFGWLGLILKLLAEIVLFFITRVWTNYYRLLLFLFMFIYQFTGSFVTNMAEYVIWILAFTNVFSQFDARVYRREERAVSISSS